MPLKALLGSIPVYAASVTGSAPYECTECGAAMYYRSASKRDDGVRVVAHFAHSPVRGGHARECTVSGQSEEHLNAKQTILSSATEQLPWLANASGELEVCVGPRRADVMFTLPSGQRVVFEPQFTKIARAHIAERTRDYHRERCHVVWCFPQKRRGDLYQFARMHFFCIGLLSDDGNDVSFSGRLDLQQEVSRLRCPFDDGALLGCYVQDAQPLRKQATSVVTCCACGRTIQIPLDAPVRLCDLCLSNPSAARQQLRETGARLVAKQARIMAEFDARIAALSIEQQQRWANIEIARGRRVKSGRIAAIAGERSDPLCAILRAETEAVDTLDYTVELLAEINRGLEELATLECLLAPDWRLEDFSGN